MNKVLSLFLGVVLGKVKEIRHLDNDKNGNPQAYLVLSQQNPWSKDHFFDHWIKCWGKSNVEEASHAKVGHYALVVFKSFPYSKTNNGKEYPSMQHQAVFIFTLGSLLSGGSSGHEVDNSTARKPAPKQQAPASDEAPF